MTRRRRRMFWLRLISLIFLGLITAVIIALSQVNLESLRGNIVAMLQNATGYQVQIDGLVSWKFSLRPRVELNQLRIANADWAKEKYGFSAERMDVTLDLFSLFQSRPTIRRVKLYDTVIKIETNDNGEISLLKNENGEATDKNEKEEKKPAKFPLPDSPFGRIEFENLNFDNGEYNFHVSGLMVRYMHFKKQREYNGWIKPTDELYPFIIRFDEYNDERKVYPVNVALSTGGNALIANVALEATSKIPIDFIIKGDIVDVRALKDLLDIDLTSLPKVSVNISGGFKDKNTLVIHKSSITMRGTDINMSGTYDWGGKVPYVKANISSKKLNLLKLVPEMYSGWVPPTDRELNVFHDINLHGSDIRKFDLDINVDLKHFIVYRDMDLINTKVNITYKNEKGRLDANLGMAGGQMEVGSDFTIDKTGDIFVKAGVRAKNFTIGKLMEEIRISDFIVGLPIDIYGYFETHGKNMTEWMQTITGPVVAYSVGEGYAYPKLVENIYGTDVLTSLRHSIQDLFTEDKKHDKARISGVAVNLKVRDGYIETRNGVAIETNSINARLAGQLDLGQETIDLALTTVPSRGLKLSLTGSVVNTVEIVGNLAEPDIKINGVAMAGKVASATGLGLLLVPFTGGVSFVAGLLAGGVLENWLADSEPCKTALEKGAPAEDSDSLWLNSPVAELANKMIKQ